MNEVSAGVNQFELQQIDITVEVTAMGEVRMIGAVGAEVTGGLKLVFVKPGGRSD